VGKIDLDALISIVSSLEGRLSRVETGRPEEDAPETPTAALVSPFWDCTYATGLTMTTGAGLDWDALFDNRSASNWMRYRLAAGFGSFDKGNLGFAAQRRWVISWKADHVQNIRCLLSGTSVYTADTDANIQVKLNGSIVEYAAGSGPFGNVAQIITLTTAIGQNRLAISADTQPDTVQFCGILFDDPSQWLDPRTAQTYIP